MGLSRTAAALLALGGLARLVVGWLPATWQLERGPLVDDSFYYFVLARRMAAGELPSFDGEVLTSGFQALWAMMLVPLFAVTDDPWLPLHLAFTVQVVLFLVTGIGLHRLAVGWGQPGAGTLAVALWSLSPYVVEHAGNGMETGLATCLAAWAVVWGLSLARDPSASATTRFGLLCGALVLARVDGALLAAALTLPLLVRAPALAVRAGLVAVLVALPWFGWCFAISGSPLPESGAAVRQLSSLYAEVGVYGPAPYGSAAFVWDNLERLLRVVVVQPLVVGPLGYLAHWLRLPGALWVAVAATAAAAVLLSRRGGRLPAPVTGWAVALLLAYAVLVPGQWFYDRYTFVLVALLVPWTAALWSGWPALVRVLLLATTLAVFARQGQVLFAPSGMNTAGYARLVDVLPPGRLAVLQAGTIGYFAEQPIVAVDGKLHAGARQALAERRFGAWLAEQDVVGVCDPYPWLVDLVLQQGSVAGPAALKAVPLHRGDELIGLCALR